MKLEKGDWVRLKFDDKKMAKLKLLGLSEMGQVYSVDSEDKVTVSFPCLFAPNGVMTFSEVSFDYIEKVIE